MFRIIDIITILLSLFVMHSNEYCLLERFGGSTVLFIFCYFIYFLSYAFKKNQLELSILNIIILTIIGINYLSSFKSETIFTINILNALSILLWVIYGCFIALTLYTIQTIKDKSYKDEYGIVGIILARFLFIPGLSIPIAITSAYAMMQNPYSKIIKVGYFDYVSISLFVLIVYFVDLFCNKKNTA